MDFNLISICHVQELRRLAIAKTDYRSLAHMRLGILIGLHLLHGPVATRLKTVTCCEIDIVLVTLGSFHIHIGRTLKQGLQAFRVPCHGLLEQETICVLLILQEQAV